MDDKLKIFEDAFYDHGGGIVRTCECGVTHYNDSSDAYGWEDGELDKLHADPKAVPLDRDAFEMSFEGRRYVTQCQCWHERAKMIMRFLDSHGHSIAIYFRLEKERKTKEAEDSPEIV